MAPSRVLYIATTTKGGSAFSLYHLARGLDRQRYEPVVLFLAQSDDYILQRLAEAGIRTHVAGRSSAGASAPAAPPAAPRDIQAWLRQRVGGWAGEAYGFAKAALEFWRTDLPRVRLIQRLIREHQAALVHLNNGLRNGRAGVLAAWLTGTPCVCHVRTFDDLSRFDRLFAGGVRTFIYNSQAVAQHAQAQGLPAARGVVVHNALDLLDFSEPAEAARRAVRAEFGWAGTDRLVGIVGRLDWWKGHEHFLRALASASQRLPDLKGLIIGAPEESPRNQAHYQALLQLHQELGLAGRVVFTGFRSDVPRLVAALEALVLSSTEPEPFGRVLIEGMAAGRVVIATAAGGVLDVIEDEVTGLLVPPADPAAIAAAIERVVQEPELARRLGAAARQRVEERFTIQRHVAAVQRIYQALPEPARRGGAGQRRMRVEP
ncbi:MAG: glycosyltransferase [Anaerolineales bacterium]|nr:glycosyltransferase [Anaerolineales bacterium]